MRSIDESTTNFDEDTLSDKYLTFWIGNELYGIDISYVTEIVGIQEITVLPDTPDYIKGIINLRGIIIPLMDVRLRFSMAQKEYDDRTCVVVINYASTPFGLIVDSVSEVIDLAAKNIVDLPPNSMGLSNRYIKNIGKLGSDVLLLVDCEKLLIEDEFEAISEVTQ